MRLYGVVVCLVLLGFGTAAAAAETHKVSDIETLAYLLEGRAQPGDIIEIQPGTYYLDRPRIFVTSSGTPEAPIIITGKIENGVRPIICASRTHVWNGIFYFPEETHDVVVENLELRNAQGDGRGFEQVFSRNAAGIFMQGSNLTVRNCHIHGSENGLFATRTSDFIVIENCNVGPNGRTEHQRGDGTPLNPHRTHNFYFSARHQIIRNCYIHDALDAQNFKSRGRNTIFAYNWVEEDTAYSVEIASGNERNTLWLGNVVIKRTNLGINQGRLLGIGDGGAASGTLVVLNNTLITYFPRDFYFWTQSRTTTDAILMNNVFAGPGESFGSINGQGTVTGKNNWVARVAGDVPEGFENTTRGDDAGFADMTGFDFRLRGDSPLINGGVSQEEYLEAIRLVTQYSRGGANSQPSPIYLKALEDIENPYPAYQPIRRAPGYARRAIRENMDIGAYEFVGDSQ